jgi:hypothetical protein
MDTCTAGQPAAAAHRIPVASVAQMPQRGIALPALPSACLDLPLAGLLALGAELERRLQDDLARYDILDAATLRDVYEYLTALARLRGAWDQVAHCIAQARALQDKPAARLCCGIIDDLLARQREEQRDAAWLGEAVRKAFSALPWLDVQEWVRTEKAALASFNPALLAGALQVQYDPMAHNPGMVVTERLALVIIARRVQIDAMHGNQAAVADALQQVVDAHQSSAPGPDVWTPRTFAILPTAPGTPVVVGIWDSGIDLTLFDVADGRGVANDDDGMPADALLLPLGAAQARWPALHGMIKGAMDQLASVDSPEARAYLATVATLRADGVRQFGEDLRLAMLHVHGTHVASVAVDGNPFARVYAGTMLMNPSMTPDAMSEARARARGAAHQRMVHHFVAAGVRVVNMSWRYTAGAIEMALAYHQPELKAVERKAQARHLFQIESDALLAAIRNAPHILFVAAAGNEDNNADFQEYIPAGLQADNLITVGAADIHGSEATFSSAGKSVVVHANGVEVDGLVPGGVRMRFSGTSVASPQVANLAAKLLALRPALTSLEVKALILAGASRMLEASGQPGRVNLLDPRRSAALAGIAVL